MKGARAIYSAKNRKEAQRAFARWEKKWRAIASKAVRCLEKDLEELLHFNNVQSIERIVFAMLSHLNEQWGQRPLMEFTQNG